MSQNYFRKMRGSYHIKGNGKNNVLFRGATPYIEFVKIKYPKYKINAFMVLCGKNASKFTKR